MESFVLRGREDQPENHTPVIIHIGEYLRNDSVIEMIQNILKNAGATENELRIADAVQEKGDVELIVSCKTVGSRIGWLVSDENLKVQLKKLSQSFPNDKKHRPMKFFADEIRNKKPLKDLLAKDSISFLRTCHILRSDYFSDTEKYNRWDTFLGGILKNIEKSQSSYGTLSDLNSFIEACTHITAKNLGRILQIAKKNAEHDKKYNYDEFITYLEKCNELDGPHMGVVWRIIKKNSRRREDFKKFAEKKGFGFTGAKWEKNSEESRTNEENTGK